MLIALALFISTIVEGAHTVWTTQPIVEAKDAVFDPAIIGDWHEVNPPGLGSPFATSITKAKDGKSYVVARRGEELRQPIQLTKIGDHYFLQEISDRNKAVYMRRVAIVGGDLFLVSVGSNLVAKAKEYRQNGGKIEISQKRILVTRIDGTPEEVRGFLRLVGGRPVPCYEYQRYTQNASFLPPPAKEGLASRSQQTLEYWLLVASTWHEITPWLVPQAQRQKPGEFTPADLADWYDEMAMPQSQLPIAGIDADALAVTAEVLRFCQEAADALKAPGVRLSGDDPVYQKLAKRAEEVLAAADAAEDKLGKRYKTKYPRLRDSLNLLPPATVKAHEDSGGTTRPGSGTPSQ